MNQIGGECDFSMVGKGESNADISHAFRFATKSLSPREVEITLLYIDGLALKEIAWQLNISVHTVEQHRANIYRKLRLHSRHELLKQVASAGEF